MHPMLHFLYIWIDTIWLPIAFFGVHKKHRWWSLGLVLGSMILIRLLAETFDYIGYPQGIMGILESNVHNRGLVVSGIFYILFLLVAHFSKNTQGVVFMAACLSFFFMIFVTTSIVMVL